MHHNSTFKILFLFLLLVSFQVSSGQTSLELLKDISSGSGNASLGDFPGEMWIKHKNIIYFTADDGVHGTELWKTDGTVGGTRMIKDIVPGPGSGADYYTILAATEDLVFFSVPDNEHQSELWRTDGTASGTFKLTSFPDEARIGPGFFTPCKDKMFFLTVDNFNVENLWVTDGTTQGTIKVSDLDNVYPCLCVDDLLYFKANIYTQDEMELWRTDGTTQGTFLIKDNLKGDSYFIDGIRHAFGWFPFTVNNHFVFTMLDEIWETDGTQAGTTLMHTIDDEYVTVLNSDKIDDNVFFTRDYGWLWTSDGVDAVPLYSFIHGMPLDFKKVNGTTYFTYIHGDLSPISRQKELWKTNGTPQGTVLLKNIGDYHNDAIFDNHWTAFQDKLVFEGKDLEHGKELWISDGTPEGTKFFKELVAGYASANIQGMTQVGSSTYFIADDNAGTRQIWRLDGIDGNVKKVTSGSHYINSFVLLENRLIVNASTEEYGERELFYYDLEKDTELSLSVYPNPSSSRIIEIKSDINFSYQIYNSKGEAIVRGTKNQETEAIDLNGMPAGYYMLVARSNKNLATRKILLR